MQRVDLVARHVVERAQTLERGHRLLELPDLEAELGHVERGHQILGLGLGDPLRLGQRLLVVAERAVHVDEADRRGGGAAHALRRLAEVTHGLLLAPGRSGGVAEVAERHLVGGVELDRAAEGVVGLVHAPLGGERLPQVVPSVGVLRSELGRASQLLGRILGVELHARAPGEHQQLDILRRASQTRERHSAGLAIFAGLELSACRLRGSGAHRSPRIPPA